MGYSDFGLDNNKTSKDPDQKVREWFCVFGNHEVKGQKAYGMCFSNFVCCKTCLIESQHPDNSHRWKTGDCDMCRAKQADCYHGIDTMAVQWTMCRDCYNIGVKHLITVTGHTSDAPDQQIPITGQLPLF